MRDIYDSSINIKFPGKRRSKCSACKGTGKCQNCHGTGRISGKFYESSDKSCKLCDGTGKCHACKGKGLR